MTKCSVLPRGFGTLPAGSAVRLKSRFELYSASGALDAPRFVATVAERLAADLADVFFVAGFDAPLLDDFAPAEDFARVEAFARVQDFALGEAPRLAAVVEPALGPRFAVVFARVAVFRGVVRVAPERAPARFAAMPSGLAKNMPERPRQPLVAPLKVTGRRQPVTPEGDWTAAASSPGL